MKPTILSAAIFMCLVFLPLRACPQTWFPDEAVWYYGHANAFGDVGHVRVDVGTDTVIAAQTCRTLLPEQHLYNHPGNSYHTYVLDPIHLYEQDGLVRAWSPTAEAFDTLYHMQAQPGDLWRLPRLPDWRLCEDGSHMLVTGTGTMLVSGTELQWLAVEVRFMMNGTVEQIVQDTIIERIGTTGHYLLAHDHCNEHLDQNRAGAFRCYQDMDITHPLEPEVPCDFIVGVTEFAARSDVFLFPNPGTGYVTIHGDAHVSQLELFDATGRLALSMAVNGDRPIDLSHLGSGAYTYRLISMDRQMVAQGQWVKL